MFLLLCVPSLCGNLFLSRTKNELADHIASDRVETSHYEVKEAFDANVSFASGNQMGSSDKDVGEPDIGTG